MFGSFAPALFAQTFRRAANEGIYNDALAAGLIWSPVIKERNWQFNVAVCFLLFVAVAGVMAALTVALKSGLAHVVPAIIALALLVGSKARSGASRTGTAGT